MRHASMLRLRQNPALALVSGAGRWRDVRLKSSRMAWSRGGRLRAAAPEEHMQGVRASASTSAKGAHARSAGAASTSAKEQRQGVRGRRAPAHQEHMQGDDDDTAMMILCGAGVREQQRQRSTCKECGRRRAPAPKEHMQGVRGRRAPAQKNKGKECGGGHGPQTQSYPSGEEEREEGYRCACARFAPRLGGHASHSLHMLLMRWCWQLYIECVLSL